MHRVLILAFVGIVGCGTLAQAQPLKANENCSRQAKRIFVDLEAEDATQISGPDVTKGTRTLSSRYQSHYNINLKRCLVLIETHRFMAGFNTNAHSVTLLDAHDKNQYGKYLLFSSHDVPVKCELSPPHQQMTICKSRAQFDTFVAKYMTE